MKDECSALSSPKIIIAIDLKPTSIMYGVILLNEASKLATPCREINLAQVHRHCIIMETQLSFLEMTIN